MDEQVEDRRFAPHLSLDAKRPRVLIVGLDHQLLQSRAWVMEGGNLEVLITTDLEEAQTAIAGRVVDGLLVCHSLSKMNAESIVKQAGIHGPDMPVLLLTSMAPAFLAVEAFDVSRGPRALLAKCIQLFTPSEPRVEGPRL